MPEWLGEAADARGCLKPAMLFSRPKAQSTEFSNPGVARAKVALNVLALADPQTTVNVTRLSGPLFFLCSSKQSSYLAATSELLSDKPSNL